MDESSFDDKRDWEMWDSSNCMCLMIMKHAILETFRGYKFYNPTLKTIFEMGIAQFFEDVEFRGRNKVKDIIFEEELVLVSKLIPIVTFDYKQVSIPIVVQEANLEPQKDDVDQTPTQVEAIVSKEQTQQPQQSMPLR